MTCFARLLATDAPSAGDLALALAAELAPADLDRAERRLAGLADAVRPAAGRPPLEQLAHCGRATAERVHARVRPGAVDDLLLDRVLISGVGDPACWAIACVEAAAAAGIPLGIVADSDDHLLVAHRALGPAIVVEPQAPDVPLEADRLPAGELDWRDGSATALVLLDRIVARAVRAGRISEAVRAADLRLELPLAPRARRRLAGERQALAARLN